MIVTAVAVLLVTVILTAVEVAVTPKFSVARAVTA